MPPIWKRNTTSDLKVHQSAPTSLPPPSTWKAICAVSGSLWFSYLIYDSATHVWQWIQKKIELRNKRRAEKLHPRLGKRNITSKTKVIQFYSLKMGINE